MAERDRRLFPEQDDAGVLTVRHFLVFNSAIRFRLKDTGVMITGWTETVHGGSSTECLR